MTTDGIPFTEGAEISETALGGTSKGKESITEVAGTCGIALAGVEVQASALDDYGLACKAFTNFFYLIDASKLLVEALKTRRRKALDCFIRVG